MQLKKQKNNFIALCNKTTLQERCTYHFLKDILGRFRKHSHLPGTKFKKKKRKVKTINKDNQEDIFLIHSKIQKLSLCHLHKSKSVRRREMHLFSLLLPLSNARKCTVMRCLFYVIRITSLYIITVLNEIENRAISL